MSQKGRFYKIILIGDTSVGKTCILSRYVNDKFTDNFKATIGADLARKDIVVGERTASLQLWDTAGTERYLTMGPSYYRGADACILVYDVSCKSSFDSLQKWKDDFLVQANPKEARHFPFMVLGNKSDIPENFRKVSAESGKSWSTANGVKLFYEALVEEILKQQSPEEEYSLPLKTLPDCPHQLPSRRH